MDRVEGGRLSAKSPSLLFRNDQVLVLLFMVPDTGPSAVLFKLDMAL